MRAPSQLPRFVICTFVIGAFSRISNFGLRISDLAFALFFVLPFSTFAQSTPPQDQLYNIPRCTSCTIGATLADWNGQGIEVRTLCRAHANPWPQANPPPSLQIAWSTAGLLLEITSHHAHPIECDYIRQLFRGDSVEFFLSTRKGSRDRYMLLISPGLDPRYPQPRHCFFPDPSEEGEKDMSDYRFDCTRTPTPDGYRLRVLLPWSNLNLSPAPNTELALQVYVMEAQPHGLPLVAMWNPLGQSHLDPQSTQRVRLVDSPVSPVQLNTAAQDDPQHQLRTVRIVAPLACAGRSFLLQGSDGTQVSGTLAAVGVQAFAELSVPIGQSCQVQLGSEISTVPILPPPDDLATIMTQKLQCTFTPTLFDSDLFPEPKISGAPHYRLQKVTYFDATYHPLSSPLTPGRYGAVVEIADASNNITRRFRTLFRLPPHTPPLTPGQSGPAPPRISPPPTPPPSTANGGSASNENSTAGTASSPIPSSLLCESPPLPPCSAMDHPPKPPSIHKR
jgi:hypothetical protein